MKRSEAVEEIRKVLAMNGKDDGMGELEEALLHTIEVLGMLPPELKEESFKMLPSGEMIYNVNEWEPEDEAK